jgi:prepilin-type N-terminal cleavage/methylation domain-containing protein
MNEGGHVPFNLLNLKKPTERQPSCHRLGVRPKGFDSNIRYLKTNKEMQMEMRKPLLIGLGLFGLFLMVSVVVTQRSFDHHTGNYEQALAATTAWESDFADFLTVRGQIKGVVESVSALNADSIEEAISTLPTSSNKRLNAGIEEMALAAMKTADGLRRNDLKGARQHAQSVVQISASLSPVITELEQQLERQGLEFEAARSKAFAGMSRGEGIEASIFLTFALAFLVFLALGSQTIWEWMRRHQPRPALVPAPRRLSASRGFSLVELLMVVAITLVLSTIAIANIAAVVSSARVRAGISSVSGLLQNTRMMAVKKNRTMTAHMATIGSRGTLIGYVKEATDDSDLDSNDAQVEWEAPVIRLSAPTGENAPDALGSDLLGYPPQTGDLSFNSRGLPCSYSGGNCTNYGFRYYFKDTSRQGSKGWAALSISPAGKIKKWFWNGSRWSD